MNVAKTLTALSKTLSISCCLFIVSCQNSSQQKPVGSAPATVLTDGTGDGGGGNGAGGRVYDAYTVDPTQLDAFKKHLAPLFKESPETAAGKNSWNWKAFFKLKVWYVAPVKLKPLAKESLGLSFTDDNTQQLAIQTPKAIWIDSGYFEKMNSEDQAQLILHEFVMSIYFLKFKKMSELCEVGQKVSGIKSSTPCSTLMDELFPPTPEAPLKPDDNDNIRNMTGWLWRHREAFGQDDVSLQFLLNGFDQRIFSNFINSSKHEDTPEPGPASILTDLLEEALLLNRGPTECLGVDLKDKADCSMTLEASKISYGPNSLEGRRIQIQLADKSLLAETNVFDVQKLYPSKMTDLVTKDELVMIPLSPGAVQNPKKGDKARYAFVIAKETKVGNDTKLKFFALISIPQVITKINKVDSAFVCSADRPRATNLNEDIIIATTPDVNTTYLRWLAKAMIIGGVPCYSY